jgi:Fe-S-cluster containining protein
MTREDELDALYADLPKVDCIGACWDSCSRIAMTSLEHVRTQKAGARIPNSFVSDAPSVCPALTMLHQCGIYAVRPLICRLYGVAEGLRCSYGCMPLDGRPLLTDAQTYEYLARAHDIAGEHAEAAAVRRPWKEAPERAEQIMREARRQREDELLARDVRRRALLDSGKPLLFVRGRGQISKDPPASGANSY